MTTKVLLGVSALVLAALTAQAVEDGKGTNIVRNLRVNDGGTMTLGGTAITNWLTMPVGTGTVSLVDFVAWSNTVRDATNALDTAVSNVSYQVTNILYGATNNLNTRVAANETGKVSKTGDIMTGTLTNLSDLTVMGKVGVGGVASNIAAVKLHVIGGNSGAALDPNTILAIEKNSHAFIGFNTPNSMTSGFLFGDPESTASGQFKYNHATDQMLFYSKGTIEFGDSAVGAANLIVLQNANVGVGTNVPNEKFEVAGLNYVSGMRLSGPNYSRLAFFSTNTDANNRNWAFIQNLTLWGNLELWKSTAANGDPQSAGEMVLTVNRSGNVGIGTASPAQRLHINGSAIITTNLTVSNTLTVAGTFVQAVATSTQIISVAGSAIPVASTFIPIVSDGADRRASIANGSAAGQILILQGQDDTATVTLTNNALKVLLANGVNFTFKKNNTMQLIWNNDVWAELNRIAQ